MDFFFFFNGLVQHFLHMENKKFELIFLAESSWNHNNVHNSMSSAQNLNKVSDSFAMHGFIQFHQCFLQTRFISRSFSQTYVDLRIHRLFALENPLKWMLKEGLPSIFNRTSELKWENRMKKKRSNDHEFMWSQCT